RGLAEGGLEVDARLPGARVEALLRVAALIAQARQGRRIELPLLDLRLGEDEIDDDLVEVVAAELVDARGREDLVARALHPHQRGVERAAAEVVDDDVIAPRRERVAMTVRVLEPGGGRL